MFAPSRIASSETRTATAVVTPTTVTSEEPRRCAMLRRPVVVSSMVCLSTVMCTPSSFRERLSDLQFQPAPRGRRAAENREGYRETHSRCDDGERHGSDANEAACLREDERGEREPDRGGQDAEDDRLRQDEAHDQPIREPDRLEHGELGYALANGLHHERAGGEEQREEDRAHDRPDDEVDVGDALDLRGGQVAFGL